MVLGGHFGSWARAFIPLLPNMKRPEAKLPAKSGPTPRRKHLWNLKRSGHSTYHSHNCSHLTVESCSQLKCVGLFWCFMATPYDLYDENASSLPNLPKCVCVCPNF